MANETDPVRIVIEVVDNFSDDIAELIAEIESIGGQSPDVDVDVDDNGDIERMIAEIKKAARPRAAQIRADLEGAESTEAMLRVLSRDRTAQIKAQVSKASMAASTVQAQLPAAARGAASGPEREFRPMAGAQRFARTLDKLRPNIMQVWNALAALIPIFFALGAAAIGLAGAFIAVGTAGAAIIGLGLLGWGDDLGSSLEEAQRQAGDLADRLFEVLEPVSNQFQPILQDWMEGAPRQVEQLVDPLQRMTEFRDTLEGVGSGTVSWLGDVLNAMANLDDEIHQITMRFGEVAGAFLIEIMSSLVEFAAENQEELIRLSAAIATAIGALFDLFVAVAFALARFSPFLDIIAAVADFLNNDITIAIMTLIGVLFLLETVVGSLFVAMGALNTVFMLFRYNALGATVKYILSSYLPAVQAAISSTWGWVTAVSGLNAALRALLVLAGGLGIVLAAGSIVGGFLGGGGGGGGGGGSGPRQPPGGGAGTYINVEGDVGRREMDRVLDRVPGETRSEMTFNDNMEG